MQLRKTERTPKKVIGKQIKTTTSIVCGTQNPASFGCDFFMLEGGELATVFTAGKIHEGHEGILHGGLSAAILDEVMGRCNFEADENGVPYNDYVTGEMTVRYCLPVQVGREMRAFGRIDRSEGRKNFNSGEIVDADGTIYAYATATYVRTAPIRDKNLQGRAKNGLLPLLPGDPDCL